MAKQAQRADKGAEYGPRTLHTAPAPKVAAFHAHNADWMAAMPEAPVFRPTAEEFQDPLAYIRRIRPDAERYGICKIIPPVHATVPASKVLRGPNDEELQFRTRYQPVACQPLQKMETQRFAETEELYTIRKYNVLASKVENKLIGLPAGLPDHMAEAEYWRRRVSTENKIAYVQYGNDVEGTAFCDHGSEDPLGRTDWNMRVLPKLPSSTLDLLAGEIPGVSTPMLYIGMVSATFAWHVEDHYLYSINYQHQGAAKTWYGVPGSDADGLEKVAEKKVFHQAIRNSVAEGLMRKSDAASETQRVLLGKTTMFSPKLLMDAGVKVCRAVQKPGEFIVTFPRAYHAGFSHGFSIGEAVNFGTGDWFLFGEDCSRRYSRLAQAPILPHEYLLCQASAQLCDRLQRAQRGGSAQEQSEDRSLAGTFVSLIRQQHAQRARLLERGAQHLWKETDQMADCARCKKLSYITVAIDNSLAAGLQETLCLDCAMATSGRKGCTTSIMCSRHIPALEETARWLEQHSLLKNRSQEWLEMRKGRGLGEPGLPGMLELPLPTEFFQWRQLPEPNSVDVYSSPPVPEEIHFPDEPTSGRIPILPPQALTLDCLAPSQPLHGLPVSQAFPAGLNPHWQSQPALAGFPLDAEPTIQPHLFVKHTGCCLNFQPAGQPEHRTQHMAAPQFSVSLPHDSYRLQQHEAVRAPGGMEEETEAMEWCSAAMQAQAMPEAIHHSSAGIAEHACHAQHMQLPLPASQSAHIHTAGAAWRLPQQQEDTSQAAMRGAAISWNPMTLHRGAVQEFTQDPAQQTGPSAEADGDSPVVHPAEQGSIPGDVGAQQAELQSKPEQVPAAQHADAVRLAGRKQQAAGRGHTHGKTGAKRKREADADDTALAEEHNAQAAEEGVQGTGTAETPDLPQPPEAVNTTGKASPGPKRAKLSPSRAKPAPYGPPAVARQETEVPGKDGLLYPRTIYHLQQECAVCLLDLREFCRATGWQRHFHKKASTRDMASRMRQLAREQAEAAGAPEDSAPPAPQQHPCSNGDHYLLGLAHAQSLYSLSTQPERELMDAFCADVWPQKYSARTREAAGTADVETLQVAAPSSSLATEVGGLTFLPAQCDPKTGAGTVAWDMAHTDLEALAALTHKAKLPKTRMLLGLLRSGVLCK
ncbi:hypothetical protein CVIRNUC_001956 [Coccomyxa viridis]|uniref:Uncharacterized protein n=1 Tax=Coccomyxa viridis TaxID=1274662 RepID=A0AAV1HXH8_9CHLO|nr:hypothetical protein CVIRNUC_001956 [Coccomyxa viridis]